MNCQQCNAPVDEQARFCRNCGAPVAISSPTSPSNSNSSPTVPTSLPQPPYALRDQRQSPLTPPASPQWNQPVTSQPQGQWLPQTQPQYMPPDAALPGSMRSTGTPPGAARVRRRRIGWPLRLLIIVLVVLVVLTGGWFLVARPILHSVAQNQFDQVASNQVNLIPPLPPVGPSTLPLPEGALNAITTLSHNSSGPVQNVEVHIAPAVTASDGSYTGGVEFDFQVFGFGCSIRGIPVASNGQIVMTRVQVNGILSFIMSADEMTTLLNGQIQNALTRVGRQVSNVTLENQALLIQFSSGFSPPV